MTSPGAIPIPEPRPLRVVADRDAGRAVARCLCYAAFSELTASPHEIDPRPTLAGRLGAGEGLPGTAALDAVLAEIIAGDIDDLRREYSGLFEVGSQGPPVPIREDLQTGQRAGTREDIIRFYEYFGYALAEKYAWQPDHLSVELEFMHLLCHGEATGEGDQASFQLAQADFSDRHLMRWIPGLRAAVERIAAGSRYARVLACLDEFVSADFAFQQSTIRTQMRHDPG